MIYLFIELLSIKTKKERVRGWVEFDVNLRWPKHPSFISWCNEERSRTSRYQYTRRRVILEATQGAYRVSQISIHNAVIRHDILFVDFWKPFRERRQFVGRAATRLRSWWVILIELHARYRVQWILRLFLFFLFANLQMDLVSPWDNRRWGLTWDRITCDVVTARRIIFCNFLSFEYILGNCFIYPCRCRMFSFVSRCRQSTTL